MPHLLPDVKHQVLVFGPHVNPGALTTALLALIDSGQYDLERYRDYSQRTAERFGLRCEEIPSSDALVKHMLHGLLDSDSAIAEPGETISYLLFKRTGSET